jgi:hypothetical protein
MQNISGTRAATCRQKLAADLPSLRQKNSFIGVVPDQSVPSTEISPLRSVFKSQKTFFLCYFHSGQVSSVTRLVVISPFRLLFT